MVFSPTSSRSTDEFRHAAVFYRGMDDFVGAVLPFISEGLEREEPVVVAVPLDRIQVLEEALGPDAAQVTFIDMAHVGRNPARIIPAWRRFVGRCSPEAPIRGVGEPVWAGRRDVEIEECRLHESLLNVAFDGGAPWQLMCPYDVEALPGRVVEDAMRTHPVLSSGADRGAIGYEGHGHALAAFSAPLSAPPGWADEITFERDDLAGLRGVVRRLCAHAGVKNDPAEDVVLAAHELATNSVMHGGGQGVLRAWTEPDAFVVEVSDSGTIEDPLVGRELTFTLDESGRGVWMANQLCDLVQVRSTSLGTVVRLFAWL